MKYTTIVLLTLTIFLGLFVRLWKLGEYPATMYGDEQAFAWNAYNILLTGQDEYGTPYPLQFRSFDDYKAPIPVYILVPLFSLFGMSAFVLRLPIALAGSYTIFVTYLISRKFFTKKVSLLSAFLLAISPWHIHVSRGYFETTLAVAFATTGIVCVLYANKRSFLYIFSAVWFSFAIYTYFTPRILLLFLLPFLLVWKYIHDTRAWSKKSVLVSCILLCMICAPLVYQTFFGKGLSRFQKLTESVQSDITRSVNIQRTASLLHHPWNVVFHNKAIGWLYSIQHNYIEQLSVQFWYIYGDTSLRYFLGNMGMFYFVELPFFLIGVWIMVNRYKRASWLFIGWLLLAPIPTALVGKPYGLRSEAMLPVPFFFVSLGICWIMRKRFFPWIAVVVTGVFMWSFFICLLRYYKEYPVYAATWWGWENYAAIQYAKERESQYDAIFISDFYSGSTLAYAVYEHIDPVTYRYAISHPVTLVDGRHLIRLGKYYFGSLDIDEVRASQGVIPPRSLYIGRPEEAHSDEQIVSPDDGRVLFYIYKTS